MRSSVDAFIQNTQVLRSLVESIPPVNAAIDGHRDSTVRQYRTLRRQFDHVAFVVGVYAAFEQFAEDIVASYSRAISRVTSYNSLPEKLRNRHLSNSADALKRAGSSKGPYRDVDPLQLVRNLINCLSDTPSYELNSSLLSAHDRNLRFSELRDLLSIVGIACERITGADPLSSWHATITDSGIPPISGSVSYGLSEEIVRIRLDNLVDRRNEASHRGSSPTDLLNPKEMGEWLDFIEALVRSVFVLFVVSYLEEVYVKPGKHMALTSIEGPFKSNTVRVVSKPAGYLYVGQPAFSLSPDSFGARWGKIVTLQVDGVDVSAVDVSHAGSSVGIETNFKCPKRATLCLLAEVDDLVWS